MPAFAPPPAAPPFSAAPAVSLCSSAFLQRAAAGRVPAGSRRSRLIRRGNNSGAGRAPARRGADARASASSPSTEPSSPGPSAASALVPVRTVVTQLFSLAVLLGVQNAVAAGLAAANVAFPAPLAAMLLLFAVMIVFRAAGLSRVVDSTNSILFNPGVAFLSRWLAVFFVPNLVMLPLAPALPAADLPKIAFVLVAGFLFSLLSAAVVCSTLRFVVRKVSGRFPDVVPAGKVAATPPSQTLIAVLGFASAACLAFATVAADSTGYAARMYALFVTVLTFCIGQRFPKRLKMFLHPLITCTLSTIGAMALLGALTGVGFQSALAGYYIRSGASWGGGNILAALLGPAVITFAFTMDKQRKLARARMVEVVGTSFIASVMALVGTAGVARMLNMSASSRLIVIPRMITAPLAVSIAELLGANVGLAASIVALTGLLGANIGANVLSAFKVKDPVVRGLSVGASAHGLGTAALSDEGPAFPFAALAMTLVGIFSTILVAYPPFRILLLRVAVGKMVGGANVAVQ